MRQPLLVSPSGELSGPNAVKAAGGDGKPETGMSAATNAIRISPSSHPPAGLVTTAEEVPCPVATETTERADAGDASSHASEQRTRRAAIVFFISGSWSSQPLRMKMF